MIRYIAAYLGAGLVMAVLDAVWLTTMANRLYRPVIGDIMADKPDMRAAVVFYLIYLAGVVFFAVAPALRDGGLMRAVIWGALLGALAYATYDLTNQATLSVWSTRITVIDIAWGALLTALTASGGYLAARGAERLAG